MPISTPTGSLVSRLDVAATTIVSFVLFGGVLKAVKGDSFITDLALVAMGRYRGGQAKVSIGASTLFGTVSGSAVSNVAVVGPITIPMMMRAGYPPHIAAAIEAVASTGGQIMPPVMGITAFLIADYLSISYGEVVLAAIIPALLYYLAIFIQVDLEAARRGLKGLPRDQIPLARQVLKAGYAFFVPLAVLIYTVMVEDWQPGLAGMAAAASALLVGMLRPSTRPTAAGLWGAVLSTGRTMIDMLVLTGIAGIVIGGLQLSGVSFNMSTILLGVAGKDILSILVITGIICIVLGMALPTAVIYTMLAVLVAPALTELGVVPIAAHLFLFYMGMLSMVTPPVCLATFAAAVDRARQFLEGGLRRHALRHCRLYHAFRVSVQPRPHHARRRGRHRAFHRDRRARRVRHRLGPDRLSVPPARHRPARAAVRLGRRRPALADLEHAHALRQHRRPRGRHSGRALRAERAPRRLKPARGPRNSATLSDREAQALSSARP